MAKDYVTGMHHVTSCVGPAQEDIDFFTRIIGQRMVKQTVLFDGSTPIYHLYYGNRDAQLGTIMTTFPYRQAGIRGRKGTGQVAVTGYSVAEDALEFWARRLERLGVTNDGIRQRLGQSVIRFEHPSGLEFEMVGDDRDTRAGWTTDEIEEKDSVRGFNAVTMSVRDRVEQERFLVDAVGFRKTAEDERYQRFEIAEGGPGCTVIVRHDPDVPQGSWTFGEGTVHHVAFAVRNDAEQMEFREQVVGMGYTDCSESKDRNYFHSVYCRSPGGILCEFATSDIGFTVDEPAEELGRNLLLPPWFESRRAEIVAPLEPITVPASSLGRKVPA
ncbi:ring-cleaving dioxygenase [Muricoccus aerilatus]|uniref:ring-cleaving dioxygenase n=1 Tax=Muricoccus aerilatus TaxID=452982 RepID=UPI000AF3749D|nr:ring-cleaving dioxygenase [Roseomonas aerilata]